LSRLLRLKNSLSGIIFLLILTAGCARDKQKNDYVAKVNDSYLTEEDLTAIAGSYGGQKFFKEEVIRRWIDRELLYQQALKEGLLDNDEYRRLVQNSGKEIAASIMLEKIYEENMPVYKPEDVKTYFEQNGEIFRIYQTAYLVNIAEFSDEDKAIMFRSAAVESEWNKASNFFTNDQTLVKEQTNKLLYMYDLQPLQLSRVINELYPGEVSLIIPAQSGRYMVVKLLSKLEPGTIPPFDVIKDNIEKRYIAARKSELLKEYYEELYSSNEIDVKQ
jgi:hypothetical protein